MMDWRSAFIAQAKSDFEIAELLGSRRDVPLCQLLHYLQMTLEKLSKGLDRMPGDMLPPRKTHSGASYLIQSMGSLGPHTRAFHQRLAARKLNRRAYLRDILPVVQKIERLVPSLAGDGPNVEYPWALPNAAPPSVVPPCEHRFPVQGREILRVMELLRMLLATCG